MSENDIEEAAEFTLTVYESLGKVLIATAAGFIATKLCENAYERFIFSRRNSSDS